MNCCPNCFGDEGLSNEIEYSSSGLGRCYYCGSNDVHLVNAEDLRDRFELVLGIYKTDPSGSNLIHWLKEDWSLFPQMDDANAQRLLADILDDGQLVRELFVPSQDYKSDQLGQWESLRQELMHENRYFPKSKIDLERLASLLSQLKIESSSIGQSWFRARIQSGDAPFGAGEMCAPPREIASHGRANPAGIPYLYLGSHQESAISETRPHPGETCCVAEFTIPNVNLVDLRSPRVSVSPFKLTDVAEIGKMRFDLSFLEQLGEELTRPVRPQAAAFDYTPSQYLCEYIKNCGYDGVLYRSSVSDGINLALFRPETAQIGTITQHSVRKVIVEASVIA